MKSYRFFVILLALFVTCTSSAFALRKGTPKSTITDFQVGSNMQIKLGTAVPGCSFLSYFPINGEADKNYIFTFLYTSYLTGRDVTIYYEDTNCTIVAANNSDRIF